jgi:hypothetical protein
VVEATGQAARSFKLYDKCKRASEVALTRIKPWSACSLDGPRRSPRMRRRSLAPRLGRLRGDCIGLFCLNALDVLLPTMAPRSVKSGTNAPASPPQIPRSCSSCCSRASHFPSRSIPTAPMHTR